jgi:hypothetical protein
MYICVQVGGGGGVGAVDFLLPLHRCDNQNQQASLGQRR